MTLALPKPAKRAPKARKPIPRRSRPARGKAPAKRSKRAVNVQIAEADRLFSLLVRLRNAGFCECGCGKRTTDCAHHHPRTRMSVRHDFENASGLARECHQFFTAAPRLWRVWWRCKLGAWKADALDLRAGVIAKFRPEILWELQGQARELGIK